MCGCLCLISCQSMNEWMFLCHQQRITETVAKSSLMWVGIWGHWMRSERWFCFLKAWALVMLMPQIIFVGCSGIQWKSVQEQRWINRWGCRSKKRGWHRLVIFKKWFWFCCKDTQTRAKTAHRGTFVILIRTHCSSNYVEAKGFMYGVYICSVRPFYRFSHKGELNVLAILFDVVCWVNKTVLISYFHFKVRNQSLWTIRTSPQLSQRYRLMKMLL